MSPVIIESFEKRAPGTCDEKFCMPSSEADGQIIDIWGDRESWWVEFDLSLRKFPSPHSASFWLSLALLSGVSNYTRQAHLGTTC